MLVGLGHTRISDYLLHGSLTVFQCSTYLYIKLLRKLLDSVLKNMAPNLSVHLKGELLDVPPRAQSLHHSHRMTFGYVEASVVGF